jgi:serine/threonine protein kinase
VCPTGTAGTFAWAAPELLTGTKCTEKADMFSFGVVLWCVATLFASVCLSVCLAGLFSMCASLCLSALRVLISMRAYARLLGILSRKEKQKGRL